MGLRQSSFTPEQLSPQAPDSAETVDGSVESQDSLEAARAHCLLCTKTVSGHEITLLVSPSSLSW